MGTRGSASVVPASARRRRVNGPRASHKRADSWNPGGQVGEGVSICFTCKDAIAIYRQMLDRNFKISKPFVGNGLWVTSLSDPDGYRIEFESPTSLSEDTEYSEALGNNSN